jgi:uncharacterized membrane protein
MISNSFNALIIKNKIGTLTILIVSSLFSIALLAFRIVYTSSTSYSFFVWNLFLAWIPYGISLLLFLNEEQIKRNISVLPITFVWLLFFPNAPYILTDLFHLKQPHNIPFWYDLVLFISFVSNGLILGFLSLSDIQSFIEKKFSKVKGWIFSIIALLSGIFGIYIGRYLRWNNWDVISNPFALSRDLIVRLLNPIAHPRTYGVTILFFILLTLIYLTFKIITKDSSSKKKDREVAF